jgi:hypothetical protein
MKPNRRASRMDTGSNSVSIPLLKAYLVMLPPQTTARLSHLLLHQIKKHIIIARKAHSEGVKLSLSFLNCLI